MTEKLGDLIQGATLCQCNAYNGKPHQLARGKCDPRAWVADARELDTFALDCNACNLNNPSDLEPCEWIRGTETFHTALYHCEILKRALGGEYPPVWLPRRSEDHGSIPKGKLKEQEELNFIADELYGGGPARPVNTEEEEEIGFKCLTRSYKCFLGDTCDAKTEKECSAQNDHESESASTNQYFDDIPF